MLPKVTELILAHLHQPQLSICAFGQLCPCTMETTEVEQRHLLSFLQDTIPCQVSQLLHRIDCIQQEIPVPYASTARRPEEGQQAERQGKYQSETLLVSNQIVTPITNWRHVTVDYLNLFWTDGCFMHV